MTTVQNNLSTLITPTTYNALFADAGEIFGEYFSAAINNAGVGGIDQQGAKNSFTYKADNGLGSILLGTEFNDVFHTQSGVNSLIESGNGNDSIHVGIQDKKHNNFIYNFSAFNDGGMDTLYLDGIKNFDKDKVKIFYKPANDITGMAYYDVWYHDPENNQSGSVAKIFTNETESSTTTKEAILDRIKEDDAVSASYYDASIKNPGNAWAGTTTVYNNVNEADYGKITLQANTPDGKVKALHLNELQQLMNRMSAGITATQDGDTVTIEIGAADKFRFIAGATAEEEQKLAPFANTKLVLNAKDETAANILKTYFQLATL